MDKKSQAVKYYLCACGVLLIATPLLPMFCFRFLGTDIISFTGIDLIFGKTITILGESTKLGGNPMAMFVVFPALGLSALSMMTDVVDDESRGVFAIIFSIVHTGILVYMTKSVDTIGIRYLTGFWINIAVIVLTVVGGIYSFYLQKIRDNK